MTELFDFLDGKKKEETQKEIDWNEVKQDWLLTLDGFMTTIEEWMNGKKKDGVVEMIREQQNISEESIGNYNAPGLLIRMGTQEIRVKPVGRLIIGAVGRIDIIGFADRVILLNDPKQGWIYRESPQKSIYREFNAENFAEILKRLLYEN